MPDQTVRHSYPSPEKIKVWLTKHALTSGIKVVYSEVIYTSTNTVSYKTAGNLVIQHAHGRDWHRTKEAALERAEEMRRARLESLRRSIRKLEELEFYVPEENEP